jgi:aromatic-L-amino-acid decarboxylase
MQRVNEIRAMENRPSLGDTSPEIFRKQLHELADWIADYREHIEQLPVAPNAKPGAIAAALPKQAPDEGESFEQIMADVDRLIVPGMVNWSHPMFLGYFGWTTTAPAILAEALTAPLNVNAMTWKTSPAATELERVMIDWLRQWVHLPPEFDGVVYDTASVGVMHALAVAREQVAPNTRKEGLIRQPPDDLPRLRVYTSDQAHSSAEKAAIALGIGEENVRRVPSDNAFRMDVEQLQRAIGDDRAHGFQPMAVIATVGTTSTASVDPVAAISQVCRDEKIWLHVDAAYGGGFALIPELQSLADGWTEADSIVINPHKTLFVPLDFSVLYVRDLERLRRVFTLIPEYLRGDTVDAEKNYMDYGIQLGRRFRALKAWVIWRSLGRNGIISRLREQVRLAALLGNWIEADARFALAAPINMGVVCLRFVDAPDKELDRMNGEVVERINASGRAYLTQTKLHGRAVMRIGLGNVLTTEQHLRNLWKLIQNAVGVL